MVQKVSNLNMFFLQVVTLHSGKRNVNPAGVIVCPDTMFSSQPGSKDDEELRRLFYVALTRAEKHLYISFQPF
jgi:DNA helicase-2/ATP-dependent DNA helicase PcrA